MDAQAQPLAQAAQHFNRADYAQAERMCRDILQRDPSHVLAHLLLGQVFQATDRPLDAQTEYRTAIKLNPAAENAWLLWAGLLDSKGEHEKSKECLRLALNHTPHSFAIQHALG